MICLISAPTSLGLRPPRPNTIPGCYKAPEALREAGLFKRFSKLGGLDSGGVVPGTYSEVVFPKSIRNQQQMITFSRSLSDRIARVIQAGNVPLVIGGDCSVLIGAGMALRRVGTYGLVHLDGHTDFRHPGNSSKIASLAGEDLAAAIGMHWNQISNIDGLGPYFESKSTVHAGCRDDDEYISEVKQTIGLALPASWIKGNGAKEAASEILAVLNRAGVDRYWLHLDVDILDSTVMPAVDSPSPGGLDARQLTKLLGLLAPGAVGAEVTIFDPDLDPTGSCARLLTQVVYEGFQQLGGIRRSA